MKFIVIAILIATCMSMHLNNHVSIESGESDVVYTFSSPSYYSYSPVTYSYVPATSYYTYDPFYGYYGSSYYLDYYNRNLMSL